jgi:hypothetical protein
MQLNTRPFEFVLKFLVSSPKGQETRRLAAQVTGTRSPWLLNFVRWRIVLVDPQYGPCFLPTS